MLINKLDSVEVRPENGHKYAVRPIKKGDKVIKYGQVIGIATEDIGVGGHVHSHNMRTSLEGKLEYTYNPETYETVRAEGELYFDGYVRENGDVGIRNDIWIINTVGCVNKIAEKLAALTGAKTFPHPFGCSQLGGDHKTTQLILRGMVNHPNAAGVLVLGLGCENNNIDEFRKVLGDVNEKRVKFLNCQDVSDEIEEGVKLINELKEYASSFKRERLPVSMLKVGLKCGGSDGLSGITANPLVGRFSDLLIAHGGSCVLTEVPEMFGAETILMNRCRTETEFSKTVDLINNFKKYFMRYGEKVDENPSPGNKAGGITTLEDKSLGCVQKGGTAPVEDVLDYAEAVKVKGLSLLKGPGNDLVASNALLASGAQLILFTTGRGTPFGCPVPTVKVSSNSDLANKKRMWIDFNAGQLLEGKTFDELADEFLDYIIKLASGEITTHSERLDKHELAIFKDGVTL